MPVAKGATKPEYSQEQKAELVERVCQLYESQNCTIESCCKAAGISESIFRLWLTQFVEFGERYKKARAKQDETYWDMLRPLAKTSLQRLLEGEETEETTVADLNFRGTLTGQTAETVRRGKTQPNPTAVIFTLKGLYPDMFADRHKIESDITVNWHEEKTYEADSQTDESAGLPSGQSDY